MMGGHYRNKRNGGDSYALTIGSSCDCTGTASFSDEFTSSYPITQNIDWFIDYHGFIDSFLLCWKKHHALIYKMLGRIFPHIAYRIGISGTTLLNAFCKRPEQKASEYG